MHFFLEYMVTLFYKKLRIKIVVYLLRESDSWFFSSSFLQNFYCVQTACDSEDTTTSIQSSYCFFIFCILMSSHTECYDSYCIVTLATFFMLPFFFTLCSIIMN